MARARFGRADVHVRQRDYRTAGKIYQTEAERLLSDGRQNELTAIYLEFADRYFDGVPAKGPTAEKKPNYAQALTYYQRALQLRSGKTRKQKIEFRIARCLQELRRYPQAISSFRAFLKKHAGKETKDENRVAAKLEVEAQFQLGRALLLSRRFAEARKTWQDFLTSDAAKKAGGDFIPRATYQLAKTYGVPAPPSVPNLELGVAALRAFVTKFPTHKLVPQAEYDIARSYLYHGRYDDGIKQLRVIIANHLKLDAQLTAKPPLKKTDRERLDASSKQTAAARQLLGESLFVQKKFAAAIVAWKAFLDKHPSHSQWSTVQRRVLDAEYATAVEHRLKKNYAAARKSWATFLNKYPLDSRSATILFQFGSMKYTAAAKKHLDELKTIKAAGGKPDSRKLSPAVVTLFEEAISDWKRLLSKYPGTNDASHGAYMIGVTREDRLGQLADALDAYKKVTGRYAAVARKRIANLTAKRLDIATERKFRSNEKPVIKIRTRNLEKVTVKIYRIDMVDYFRKMHLASGVETLDIALIDPDKSWEYKVKDFEKYRQLTNELSIPVDGPGVTAVTVSSEKLEATTMVFVSDIDIIVKASRNELFIFAENMRTQKPAAGVSLLLSDGKTVFAEEVTNKDGILQKSYDELKTVTDLRIFAVFEGHAASTVSSLQGLRFAVGLAPKGYLYSDRPAYRAGELVHLKGIVRWVNDDVYTFKVGEKYKLDVYDARSRLIHSKEITLGKFGTFADRFTLPASAPQGNYRVRLYQPNGKQSYETRFTVHEFKLEPIQILVDLPRKVFYRGETISGKITLKYYYGTPLTGRTIQYRLANGPLQTATTDAKGEVKFSFETTQYSESQQLALTAVYPERNIGQRATLFLATRGFAIGVKTRRSVYISGETFDAAVTVSDPAGKPVATNLKLEVFELLPASRGASAPGSHKGEKLINTFQIKSNKKTGEARQTLRIDKAGYYRIRVTGTDRFKNPVSGSKLLRISGDDDAVRLRILSEKHQYKVGDKAKVQLHWREAPALALVTYEGAKVLGYRLVSLKRGANALTIPMAAKLAPNFVLSVTVMEKNHFHRAESEFLVSRQLTVKIVPNKTTYKPGDEVKVTVTTTDPQGKPVSAELSLAMIQKNLLDRFGDPQSAINTFFGGGYRKPSVRAFTSTTFRYRPKTRGISQYLLAETERTRILQMELVAQKELALEEKSRIVDEVRIIRDAERRAQRGAGRRIVLRDDGTEVGPAEYHVTIDALRTELANERPTFESCNRARRGSEGTERFSLDRPGSGTRDARGPV
ncbi:MAG: tetratricopeptide repeat protein [Planctomycetes bacterium]|nr:tetratricopeptide repeat protein [Planctomycetota bacterium]